jgi:DNA-directed RNA polymerase subunit K/omega
VDCAHGAASESTPRILEALGATLFLFHNTPNGLNINEGCGSTHGEELQRLTLESQAHLGIAHDGDADRLLLCDAEGNLVDGDEILAMTKVVRDKDGIVIDPLHKSLPFLTKFEKARILGARAKQINTGATCFVKVPENMIDGYLIAELELKNKTIPFIIRRPMPNGGSEYWSLKDLEDIAF